MMSADEQALLADLRDLGLPVASIWDWVNRPGLTQSAVPILTDHLVRTTDERLVEGIARTLTVKGLVAARPALLARFPRVEDELVRWALANALATIGIRGIEADVLSFVADDRNGRSREPLVGILHRIKEPQVEPLLIRLLDDPVLDYFAASALGICATRAGLAALEQLDLAGRSPRTRRKVPAVIAKLKRREPAA